NNTPSHSQKKFDETIIDLFPLFSFVRCVCSQPSKIENLIFMNSRSTVASSVSCKAGNKNDFFFWILVCLLPKFLGLSIACVNFQLFKAIIRIPSSSVSVLTTFGERHP
ncbi:hypothetical protein FRX31_011031, partial [Thalictrum thalictroides]